MYKITVNLPIGFDTNSIKESIGSFLSISPCLVANFRLLKLSLDSRKKQIHYLATIVFDLVDRDFLLRRNTSAKVAPTSISKKHSTLEISVDNTNESVTDIVNKSTTDKKCIATDSLTEQALINELKKAKNTISKYIARGKIELYEEKPSYIMPVCNNIPIVQPIIVGSGPAGLFAGLILASAGLKPIILERGDSAEIRYQKVLNFRKNRVLDADSNIQFGEGGAGTFSDGKLNTLTKDYRNNFVKEVFHKFGATEDILYLNKPHIGTDKLLEIIPNIRNEIIRLGGKVLFNHKVTDFILEDGKITALKVDNNGNELMLQASDVILATGHSARDIFYTLDSIGANMEQKPFSIGIRIEHPREFINAIQYGEDLVKKYSSLTGNLANNYCENNEILPTADYKLSCHLDNGRSVYTFCMCPGGEVVNASSEQGYLVTNGMSNYSRMSRNSNSAVLVNVVPSDFHSNDVLAGVEFQRKYEKLAYELTDNFLVPCQLVGDFIMDKPTTKLGEVIPTPEYQFAELKNCLPDFATKSLKQGILEFDKKMKGFSRADAVMLGVETRTSSPVRIVRNCDYESNILGLYPCGEGAGYAGGIMSAAVDGIKVAEKLIEKYNNQNYQK